MFLYSYSTNKNGLKVNFKCPLYKLHSEGFYVISNILEIYLSVFTTKQKSSNKAGTLPLKKYITSEQCNR